MNNLPPLIATPDVLSFIGVSHSKWAELRDEYNIKPVTRGKKGYIYRKVDIEERLGLSKSSIKEYDPIMKGLENLG